MKAIERLRKNRDELGKILSSFNQELLSQTEDVVKRSIRTGDKWQKLALKTLEKSQPVLKNQTRMTVETVDSLVSQFESGRIRWRKLVGQVEDVKPSNQPAKRTSKVKKSANSDLTLIKGIGPKMATFLQSSGVETIEVLASMKTDKLEKMFESSTGKWVSLNVENLISGAKEWIANN